MAEGKQFPHQNFTWNNRRWDGFSFRDDDIVISTAPKCGTTWMQMQVALLLFRSPDLPAPLARLSPWLDMNTRPLDDVLTQLDAQTHRRFVKTHSPLDGLPWDDRVTYLHVARDPWDAAVSLDKHLANTDLEKMAEARAAAVGLDDLESIPDAEAPAFLETEAERYWQWMEGDVVGDAERMSGLDKLVHHSATFWAVRDRPNVHLFHYAAMRADLGGSMARLATALGLEPPTDDLVAAADFQAMKARAQELVPNSDTPFWHDIEKFFDKARAGDWRSFGDDGPRYGAALAGATTDADLVAWLHQGSSGDVTPAA